MNLASVAKALVGGVIAGLAAAATALQDGHVTALEWVTVASATLVAGYAVWQTPWKPQA